MKITVPTTRTCPECEDYGLEVSEDPNIYECQICGSIWARIIPVYDEEGNITKKPKKLKQWLKNLDEK